MNRRASTSVARGAVRAVLAVAALVAMVSAHADDALAQGSAEGGFLDHFKCYAANTLQAARTITLTDQFMTTTATLKRPYRFCNPVDKNGEGITDPTGHLMCHRIRDEVRFAPRDVLVRNQFGDQTVHVVKTESLCNPAEKDGVPLSSAAGAFLDHFKCYRATSRAFTRRTVTLADQFTTVDSNMLYLKLLCNPVDKDGSGIKQPDRHLACYKIKDTARFVAQDVTVEDQFGTFNIKARGTRCHKALVLCVPSEKNPTPPVSGDHFGEPLAACDFNNDGFEDLAVGVPREDVGAIVDAGAVNILYGSASGLTASGSQFLHQDSPNVEGVAEADDRFGSALAAGDFDGDGFCDLAVGVPGENCGAVSDAGAVQILYGSASGLSAANDQIWNQDDTDVEDSCETDDHVGKALAAGDFNHDGFADLAIGVPDEDVGTLVDAGAVNILYGAPSGISAANDQLWNQDTPDVEDAAGAGDHFGSALATGDLNGDGFADLAIGVPNEDVGSITDAGAVNVLYGGVSGISTTNDQLWTQDTPNVPDFPEADEHMGSALATGDFDGDGFADLAIGVPDENVGSVTDAGAVNVLYGAASGLSSNNDQIWDQNKPGIEGVADAGDRFGKSLATGDFNGDGFADLSIGVPNEDVGAVVDAGAVSILYGTRSRLSYSGDQMWHQNQTGMLDMAEAGDHFGSALAAGDFDHDGFSDPAMGVPEEDVAAVVDAGAVSVLYGTRTGISSANNQLWDQSVPGVDDDPE